MSTVREKQTLTLRLASDVLDTAQDAVRAGMAPNVTAFIEAAVRARKQAVRNARLNLLAAEAMADPDFVRDMRDISAEFAETDRKSWPQYQTVDSPPGSVNHESLGEAA